VISHQLKSVHEKNTVTGFLFRPSLHYQCPIQKGKWIASSGVSYNSNTNNKTFSEAKSRNSNFSSAIEVGNVITKNVLLGAGFSPFSFKRREDYASDSYYNEKRTGYDVYICSQYFQKIAGRFSYAPDFKMSYSKSRSDFKQKAPGFQEVGSVTTSGIYQFQLQPLQFAFSLSDKFLLQTGFGNIAYGLGKTESNIRLDSDAGTGTYFSFEISPIISSIKLSYIF
jgi:hypothetical protein